MTVYTDSLSNLKNYKNDFYKIAVSSTLPYELQLKMDAWFYDLSPSKLLSERLENGELNIEQYTYFYQQEMNNGDSKSKIKWIKDYSKRNDVVLLCYEPEYTNNCHRHTLKKMVDNY